jgi:S-layer protein (TIGR01567 family)
MKLGLILVAAVMLLFFALHCSGEVIKARGPIAEVIDGNSYSWGPRAFPGFYYDIDENMGAEIITFTMNGNTLDDSTVPRGIVYTTQGQMKPFSFEGWGYYYIIGFLGEGYFAGYNKDTNNGGTSKLYKESDTANLIDNGKLCKIFRDNDDEQEVTNYRPLNLDEGYELRIKEVDDKGNKVYIELYKDGSKVDESIVEPSDDSLDLENSTYIYSKNLGDSDEVSMIAVHFKNAFINSDTAMATIDGEWQISEEFIEVEEGSNYGMMTINDIQSGENDMIIEMDNEDHRITLTANKNVNLMGNISIKVADQEKINKDNPLRFFIYSY